MASTTFEYFKFIIIVQLFFGMSVTMIAYAMPTDTQNFVSVIQPGHPIDLSSVSQNIQESAERQMDMPILEMGALVFYSGNVMVDMVLNTIFAIPEMITIVTNIIINFLPIDPVIQGTLQIFMWAVISALYIIGILSFVMDVRSGRGIV